jgi:SLOG cluster2
LTIMRKLMTHQSNARIVLGGRVAEFKGKMPGIAEEALLALQTGQPLFVLGGFGGCARDIAEDFGLVENVTGKRDWPAREEFAHFSAANLNNQLDAADNTLLARTVHIDQAVALILRGLLRLSDRAVEKQ